MALTLRHESDDAWIGPSRQLAIAESLSFPALVFFLLSERHATPAELKIFELILNMAIDHGPDTPSAKAVIAAALHGQTISESVSAGILEIDDTHGGAQEAGMRLLYRMVREKISAEDIVREHTESRVRVPGYGHRLYDTDPRAEHILNILAENEAGKPYAEAARALGEKLNAALGKNLPVNIDGAIAAALCSFGFDPSLGKAVFIVARMPGLCAHFLNNRQ